MKAIKILNNGVAKKYAKITLFVKKFGKREFPNVYVKFKENCIDFSDYEDFHFLMYVLYSNLQNVELIENE